MLYKWNNETIEFINSKNQTSSGFDTYTIIPNKYGIKLENISSANIIFIENNYIQNEENLKPSSKSHLWITSKQGAFINSLP